MVSALPFAQRDLQLQYLAVARHHERDRFARRKDEQNIDERSLRAEFGAAHLDHDNTPAPPSTNGLMLTLAVFLILAWKVAGWYGLDRWLLTLLGTPWSRRPEPELSRLTQPAGD